MSTDETISTIETAISAAISLLGLITKAKADLSQDAEFTPEQRAALDAKIENIPNLANWQVND